MPVPIIAHRTCPLDAPENSLAGLRKAVELGADGVEIDVRRTLDGVPILMHDRSPRRTTGLPGPVWIYPLAVVRRARLEGTEERVPTLEGALDALPESLFLALELKDALMAAKTLRLVRERGLESRTLLWSYRETAVGYFAREAPEMETSLLRDDLDPEGLRHFLDDAGRLGARGISAHWGAITPQLVGEARDRGLVVYSMNRDLESVSKKVAAGLAAVITDHPREVREILEGVPAR